MDSSWRGGIEMVLVHIVALSLLAAILAPIVEAHEAIRVVQKDGIWWFQDSSGRQFFSVGVNCVGGCYGHAEERPIGPARKARIISILKDWGFNTIGSWSSPSLWDDLYVADRIYTGFSEITHDVFDESLWSGLIAEHLPNEVRPFLGMKNFIGYFLDNEPDWNPDQVFEFYLSLAKGRPGSQAFIAYIRRYYQGRIGKLNREWSASYASFESIPETSPPKPYPLPMRQGFLNAWRTEVAATYYRRYAAMVRALDPHHLILGIRHRGVPDIDFCKALAPYFDVNSINDYNRYGHLRPAYAELYRATGKPMIITEFSFSGFPHPGHKSLLFVDVYTQGNRGVGYRKYVLQAARAPFMVGMHWFMWQDYGEQTPVIQGFPPDENAGLVSDDETLVYEELGRWIRGTNAEIEAAHRGSQRQAPARHEQPSRTLKRFVPIMDGDVSEWPKELAIKPRQITTLRDEVQVDHTYFIAWDRKDVYLAGDISDSRLDHPGKDKWASQGDYLSIQLAPVKAAKKGTDSSTIFIYPHGEGADGQQPYAARGYDPQEVQELTMRINRRLRPGGYTLEARIPATAIDGFTGKPETLWKIKVTYQNVNEVYQTNWEGLVRLR
jgi:hypothetical protein